MRSFTSHFGTSARLAATFLLLGFASVHGNIALEIGANEGYNGNLFDVANRTTDYSTGTNFGLKYYPLSNLELSGTGDYTKYKETDALSSFGRGAKAIFIPTAANARLSAHLESKFNRQSYEGDSLQRYNTNTFEILSALGYQLNPRIHLRGSANWRFTDYSETVAGDGVINDRIDLDLIAGANWNVFGSNVLDIEWGMIQTRYDEDTLAEFLNFDEMRLDTMEVPYGRRVRTMHFSPTFSRPLGDRTGLNITLVYRNFVSGEDVTVRGAASGVLDPLSSLYEGFGGFFKVKTFLIPRVITEFGVGYWDKTHLKTEEQVWVPHPVFPGDSLLVYEATDREDDQSRAYMTITVPFPDGPGGFYIEPSAKVSYRDNSSTHELYNYYGWNISVGVSLKR